MIRFKQGRTIRTATTEQNSFLATGMHVHIIRKIVRLTMYSPQQRRIYMLLAYIFLDN